MLKLIKEAAGGKGDLDFCEVLGRTMKRKVSEREKRIMTKGKGGGHRGTEGAPLVWAKDKGLGRGDLKNASS